MAKSKKFELDDFGMPSGLDVPEFDFNPPKIKDDRHAATKIVHGFAGGVKDAVVSQSFIRNMVKEALPKGYGSAMDMADSTAGTLKSLYNDAVADVKPAIRDLKRITKRIMPQAEAVLPRAMADKVKKWADSDPDRARQMSADEQRELNLQMQLGDIFQYQTQAQAKKDATDEARSNIQDSIDHSRHRDNFGQLDAMRISLQQLAGYQNKVESNFQRKSLELQYRHYFVAMDALGEQKRMNAIAQTNLEGILKNTGLPDFVKLKLSENMASVMRTKLFESMFDKRRQFIKKFGGKLVDGVKGKIKGHVEDFKSGLGMANTALDMHEMQAQMGEGGPSGLEAGAGLVGGLAADSVAKRLGKKLKSTLGQNETVVKYGNKAQLFTENAPQIIMDWARSTKHETGGPTDWIVRGVKDAALAAGAPDTNLAEGSLDSAGSMLEPQPQTRGANKALTEIIPGFLARIYRELKIIRTGDDKQQLVTYDYTSNRFVEKNTAAKNILKNVVKDADREATRDQLDTLINQVDPQNKLSPEQRKLLGQQMLKDNMKMASGTKKRLGSAESYTGEAGRHSAKYADMFNDYFADDHTGAKEVAFARDFGRLGNRMEDSRKLIQDHANAGNRETLEQAGLLGKNNNRINMDRLHEYYYGEEFNPTDEAPDSQRRRRRRNSLNTPQQRRTPTPSQPVPPTPPIPVPTPQPLPPVLPPAPMPNPVPPPSPTQQIATSAEIIRAIHDASAIPVGTTINDTLLRIEKKMLKAIALGRRGTRGGAGADGDDNEERKRWWQRSLGNTAGRVIGAAGSAFDASVKFGKEVVDKTAKIGSGLFTAGIAGAKDLSKMALERARGFKDVYVTGEVGPRLLLNKMKLGHYRDQLTGKVIRRFKDITGAVVDEQGNVVLTAEEVRTAFIKDGIGKKAISAMGAITNTAKALGEKAFASAGVFYNGGFQLAKKAYGMLSAPADVYVRGKADPVLLARTMKAGGYRSRLSNKVINHPGDIDGAILDDKGDVVLSAEDLAGGIFDKHGKPLRVGLAKLIGGAKDMLSAGLKKVMSGAGWVKDKLKGGLDNVGSFMTNAMKHGITFAGGKDMLSRLTEIRDLLKERLPKGKKSIIGDADGDGDRDGSYADMKSKEGQKLLTYDPQSGTPQAPGQQFTKSKSLMGMAAGGIKGMYNKLRGKKTDEDGNAVEGDEININAGGANVPGGRPPVPTGPPKPGFKDTKGLWNKTKFLGKGAGRGVLGIGKFLGKSALGLGAGAIGLGGLELGATAAAIGSGAAAVGSGLLAAGGAVLSGLAAVVASPVVLGALAIAAVGAAAYYGYKYFTKKRLDSLSKIRYAQYGFAPTDEDHLQQIFGLEDTLKDAVVFGPKGATIDDKKVDLKKMMQSFGIDLEKDQSRIDQWSIWFANRFKPVFLTHLSALRGIDPKATLDGVKDLTVAQKKQYLKLIKFPEGPYNITQSPVEDLKILTIGASEVASACEMAQAELDKMVDKGPKDSASGLQAPAAAAAVTGAAAGIAAASTAAPKAGMVGLGEKSSGPASKFDSSSIADLQKQSVLGSVPQSASGIISVMGVPVAENKFANGQVNALAALRYKTYGLKELTLDKVRTLDAMETAVSRGLTFGKGNTAGWKGSPEALIGIVGPAFGIEGVNNNNATQWLSWFSLRFLPVYLKYVTAMAVATNKQDPVAALAAMKPQDLVDTAQAIYTTTSNYSGRNASVWEVPASPWPGYELNDDVRSVDTNFQGLKELSKQATLDEQKGKISSDLKAKAGSVSKDAPAAPTTAWGKFTNAASNMASSAGSAIMDFGRGIKDSVVGLFGGGNPNPSGAMGAGMGINQPGNGTGGDINSIPKPTGNKSYAAMKDTILGAAKMAGVDGKLMSVMAAIESGFDATVKAGSSSATGLFQFISDTWKTMISKYGSKYGIDPNTPATDARANALMGAEYIKENIAALSKTVKRPLTDTDIYMAHFLGAGGARKFLTADPNAIAASILPDAARANAPIFTPGGSPATVAQVYETMNNKLRTKGKQFGLDSGAESIVSAPKPAPVVGAVPVGSTPMITPPAPAPAALGAAPVAPAPGTPVTPAVPATASNPLGGKFPVADMTPGVVAAAAVPAAVKTPPAAAPVTTAAAPAVDPSLAAAGGGFVSPRSRDLAAQSQFQKDSTAEMLGGMSTTMSSSLGVQQSQLEVLRSIALMLQNRPVKTGGYAGSVPDNSSVVQPIDKPARPAPPAPVSMAKATFG